MAAARHVLLRSPAQSAQRRGAVLVGMLAAAIQPALLHVDRAVPDVLVSAGIYSVFFLGHAFRALWLRSGPGAGPRRVHGGPPTECCPSLERRYRLRSGPPLAHAGPGSRTYLRASLQDGSRIRRRVQRCRATMASEARRRFSAAILNSPWRDQGRGRAPCPSRWLAPGALARMVEDILDNRMG